MVHDYLEHINTLHHDKIAATDGRNNITFGTLTAESNELANLLVNLGVQRGDRVVYFLKRSLDCIVSTMGILISGAAYVPLDQKTPPERWQKIISDAAPRIIICNKITLADTIERLKPSKHHPDIICLSSRAEQTDPPQDVYFREDIETAVKRPLPSDGSQDDVAYVLYTSGSTGMPKGVMVTHGNIRNYIDWALEYFNITPDDCILGTAPFYFDMSTFDIFTFIASGAKFCLATEELLLFPEKLVRYMEQERVTLWKGVSSLLMYMCRAGVVRSGRMPTLRRVIFAGEPLDAQYLATWMKSFPEISFYNGYGPTEATGVSLCYHVEKIPEPGQPIPIGTPCKGAKTIVIDEDGKPVSEGEAGELCIAGDCLARGYLNDREKTQRLFTSPPAGFETLGNRIYHTGDLVRQDPDGNYIFISRKDHQVKWMGYRIELAEIESNLMAHPQVRDVVVLLANTGNAGLTELAAFFESEGITDPVLLSRFLESRLPPYMIPKKFIQIASLPRNDRGKIARDEILKQYSRSES